MDMQEPMSKLKHPRARVPKSGLLIFLRLPSRSVQASEGEKEGCGVREGRTANYILALTKSTSGNGV